MQFPKVFFFHWHTYSSHKHTAVAARKHSCEWNLLTLHLGDKCYNSKPASQQTNLMRMMMMMMLLECCLVQKVVSCRWGYENALYRCFCVQIVANTLFWLEEKLLNLLLASLTFYLLNFFMKYGTFKSSKGKSSARMCFFEFFFFC